MFSRSSKYMLVYIDTKCKGLLLNKFEKSCEEEKLFITLHMWLAKKWCNKVWLTLGFEQKSCTKQWHMPLSVRETLKKKKNQLVFHEYWTDRQNDNYNFPFELRQSSLGYFLTTKPASGRNLCRNYCQTTNTALFLLASLSSWPTWDEQNIFSTNLQ